MSKHHVLHIPFDRSKALEVVQIDVDTELVSLVHAEHPERDELGFSSFRGHHAQVAYDDLGLYREEREETVNIRAMLLWSDLTGRRIDDFAHPMIGNFVVLGLGLGGETTDVPPMLVAAAIAAAKRPEALEHIHHWVPRPDGTKDHLGDPMNRMVCDCGEEYAPTRARETEKGRGL